MRAMNLANTLVDRGHSVTILSSHFFHQEKSHRNLKAGFISISPLLSIILIRSPGYKKNLSASRFYDHFILAFNLLCILLSSKNEKPDAIFVGYPPIEASFVAIVWAQVMRIPSILDVKDLWPDLFLDAIPGLLRSPARTLLLPYFLMSRYCYKYSTHLSSMSDQYLSRIAELGSRKLSNSDKVNPLASKETELSFFEAESATQWWLEHGLSFDGTPLFIFVGSFMSVFDFLPISACARILQARDYRCKFVICGDGEFLKQVKRDFSGLNNCIIPGWITHAQLTVLAKNSSASLLPYKNIENYRLNVPNKAVDAMRFSLPIVTPLTGKLSQLIDDFGIGWVYDDRSPHSLLNVIIDLLENPILLSQASANVKLLYDAEYSYGAVYESLADSLEMISNTGHN